jgi:hypothetical protein
MTTYTSSLVEKYKTCAKSHTVGLNCAFTKFIAGGGLTNTVYGVDHLTAGCVVQVIPVPDRAIIVDGWIVTPGDSHKINVGDSGDQDRYISTAQAAATVTHTRFFNGAVAPPTGAGYQISITTCNVVRWTTIDYMPGSADCTGTIMMYVEYYCDSPGG